MEQDFLMGPVIKKEPLLRIAGAEMSPQEGQYPIFWLDLSG